MPTNDGMPSTRGVNRFDADPNLAFLVELLGLQGAEGDLRELGELAGGELDERAAEADRHPPVHRPYDASGERVDAIDFHPSYRAMERLAFVRFGLHAMSHPPRSAPHARKYALSYLFAQAEFGLLCPVNVTDSTSRMLRHYAGPELRDAWLPSLTSTDPDTLRQGTQWMTERTGGSDVGAATTRAARSEDGTWRLHGDKWFCSNANADCALTLARPEAATDGTRGLAMFLVPAVHDGRRNWVLNRLKDKLGSRSMATGEITFDGSVAFPVGDLAGGFKQMAEMVNVSRLSNAMRSAAIMRRCVLESVTHARGRQAFGRPLAELPLLRGDLLGMLLDAEAAASVVLHGAAVLDRWDAGDASARALYRIWTPLAKYWICDRARAVAATAMNVRGGNAYVEDWPNARLLRDAYLGSIWEGATNIVALDVQRAIVRDGGDAALLGHVGSVLDGVREPDAKAWREELLRKAERVAERVRSWDVMDADEVQLDARPVADRLFHVLAATLLLAEGQSMAERGEGSRKTLAGVLYMRRWLRHFESFTSDELAALDALVDWTPVEGVPQP